MQKRESLMKTKYKIIAIYLVAGLFARIASAEVKFFGEGINYWPNSVK